VSLKENFLARMLRDVSATLCNLSGGIVNSSTKKSFLLGYSMVLHSFIMYFFFVGLTTNGLNIIVSTFADENGLNRAALLSTHSIASTSGVLISILWAQLVMRKGVRIVTVISLIGGGLFGCILLGQVSSYTTYLLCQIAAYAFGCGYAQSTTNTLVSTWFPRTKGFMLGLSTCGVPMAAAFMVSLLNSLYGTFGFRISMTLLGCAMIAMGVISHFWLKNTPEDAGLHPDNIPIKEEEKIIMSMEGSQDGAGWTVPLLLRCKQVWLLILGEGLFFLVTVGFLSQGVHFLMEFGYDQPSAVRFYGTAALLGFLGSSIIGWIDTKYGTRPAVLIYGVLTFVSVASVGVLPKSSAVAYLCMCLGMTASGAISNIIPSSIGTCFGRKAYASASRVVYIGASLLKALSFSFVAIGMVLTGSYVGSYTMLGGVALVALIIVLQIDFTNVQLPPSLKEASPKST
jgi:MFS family permease